MKTMFFGSAVIATLLMAAIGCTPLRSAGGDEYYDPAAPPVSVRPSRIWVDDPYRPGNLILMERDPYSGRYFPLSAPYGAWNDPYGFGGPYGAYRDPYFHDRYGRSPRRSQPARANPQQQEQTRREGEQRRQQARDEVLGRTRQ